MNADEFNQATNPSDLGNELFALKQKVRDLELQIVQANQLDEITPSAGALVYPNTSHRMDGVIFMENVFQNQPGNQTAHLRTIEIPFAGSFLRENNSVEVTVTGNLWNNSGSTQTIEAELRLKNDDASVNVMINNTTGANVTAGTTQKGFTAIFTFFISPRGGKWIRCNEMWDIESQYVAERFTDIELSTAESVDDVTKVTFYASLTGTTAISMTMETLIVRAFEGLTTSEVHSFWSRSGIDSVIASEAATANYGTDATFAVGESTSGTNWKRRALIMPDGLMDIPAGATITKAILFLTIASDQATSGATYNVYRLLKNWTEAGVTWNKYDGVTDWATAGMSLISDYVGNPSGIDILASITVGAAETVGTAKAYEFNATGLAVLNGFLDGTYTYYGFAIVSNTELNDAYGFHSYQATTVEYRPVLYIEYTL